MASKSTITAMDIEPIRPSSNVRAKAAGMYLRAKTEERHLSHYREYVEYAQMMNDKSIFRWVAKLLPFLKYKPLQKKDRLF